MNALEPPVEASAPERGGPTAAPDGKPLRIALLTEIPAPFRIPLFNALAEEDDVELAVLFLSERDPKRPYRLYSEEFRFAWRVLPGRELTVGGRWAVLSSRTARNLRRIRPDVVIVGGWNQVAFWRALLWARLNRTPAVCWVESTARDARSGSTLAEAAKRWFVRSCSGFLVPGREAAGYVRSLRADDPPVVVAPNAVDSRIFGTLVAELRGRRDELRAELGITGPVVLYVGRLDEEKGVSVLVEAMTAIDAELVIVGGGAEEAVLRARATQRTRFEGRLDRDELVAWYAVADVFVLPARSDQWGMVLNEAAAAGLPIVSTEAPGAAWELVDDGVNGFRVPVDDTEALAAAIRRIIESPLLAARARERSLELARRFTPEAWVSGVKNVCRQVQG